jgi:hypothetical protein
MSSSKIDKMGKDKSKQELLFQLNEDGLKQALSSIHSNTANSGIEITIPNLNGVLEKIFSLGIF